MKLVGPAPAVPDDAVTVAYLDDILATYSPGGGGGGGSIASAYAGTWNAGTAYTAGQIVTWHGSTYLAATASTNSTPAVGSSAWTLLAGGLHLAGEYDPGTSYSLGDVVTYQGSTYVGLRPVTGSTPADDLYWMPLALGGSSGTPGAPGATGATGAAGTAATVAVGTVTPLAAGATPTVTNAGGSSAAVLNFGIPAGATGAPGAPGAAGAAGTAATVAVGTVTPLAAGAGPTVTNAGSSSAAVLNFGIPAGATGATGAPGAPGAPGATGAAGTAATVAVGTVSPLAAGATPTVTNAGSSSAAVLNFGIPAGAAATVAVGTVSPLAAGATPTVTNAGTSAAAVLNFGIPAGATGSTGSTGAPGAPGAAATVAVGTVSPLAAGATPTVTNAGSSSAAVLNFGIPAGATGAAGTPGTPGTAATVAVGTVSPLAAGATPTVTNAGTSAAAVLNFGIPAGATGSTGTPGTPGAAATVAVGTVSPLAAGATPTVTNAGTSAAAVLNFGIPAGATGSTGSTGAPGAAATVAVGTVSPLAAGATPTVTNAGSSSAAVLNFGIPAGATGSAGTPGTAATVAVGTVSPLAAGATPTVTNAGSSSAAVLNFGIPAGATGSTGSTGAPGAAATVAVGTVSPLAAGATPTVTNAGTSAAAVLNFGIPAGATGAAGTAATVAVGTVTPLAAGATPTVTNSGTATAATLNFGIPAGAAGSGGGGLTPTSVKTAAYTAASGQLVLCNAAAGGFTVTLPAAAAGLTVGVKKLDSSSNTVTVVGASGTIDGDPSCTIGVQDAAATLVCDGTNWQVQSTALLNTAGSSTGVADAMFSPLYTSGWWYSARHSGNPSALQGSPASTVSLNNTTVYYIPVFTFKAVAINAVAFTTGPITPSAGTTMRIGVYSASATSGAPTTLITDLGLLTFATTTNTLNTLTASAALPKGWCWFALSMGPQSVSTYGSVITAQMTPVQGVATLSAASFMTSTTHAVPHYTATGDNALALPASPPALTAAYPSVTSALPDFFYKIA